MNIAEVKFVGDQMNSVDCG